MPEPHFSGLFVKGSTNVWDETKQLSERPAACSAWTGTTTRGDVNHTTRTCCGGGRGCQQGAPRRPLGPGYGGWFRDRRCGRDLDEVGMCWVSVAWPRVPPFLFELGGVNGFICPNRSTECRSVCASLDETVEAGHFMSFGDGSAQTIRR